MCFKYPHKKAGFTLIELMVVIGIMTILTAMFLAGYRTAGKDSDLRMAAAQLMNNIRMAQSKTLGAAKYEGDVPVGGWGVYLTEDSSDYVIYADIDGDFSYDGSTEEWRTIDMPENTSISSIDIASSVDIAFEPPDPITYINQQDDVGEVNIIISDNRGNIKKVRVNFFGLIEIAE
jgi:prepilin-type N-terminal cleavage/methylation domain-containing protein